MPKYLYTAREHNGAVQSGSMEANTEEEVITRLQGRGLIVTVVTSAQSVQARKIVKQRAMARQKMHNRVTLDDQVMLCQQLSTLIDAGVPLLRSLEVLMAQVESHKLLAALGQVKQDVEAGSSLHEALAKHPSVFSSLWINLVETGEASGHLAETLRQLSKHLEAAQHLQNEARTALTYPMFLLGAAVLVMALFVYWLIPKFTGIFEAMDLELPAITRFVIGVSDFCRDYIILIAIAGVGAVYGLRRFLATEVGKWTRDRLLLSIPVFNTLFTYIQLAEFSRGLSTMLDSGVPLLSGLRILANSCSNKIYGRAVDEIREAVKGGKTLAEPMNDTGLFPPIAVQMVQVGEEVGELAGVVGRLAHYYEERVDISITRMTRLFEPIAIVVMAGIVLVIVLSIFMPIFKMATSGKAG